MFADEEDFGELPSHDKCSSHLNNGDTHPSLEQLKYMWDQALKIKDEKEKQRTLRDIQILKQEYDKRIVESQEPMSSRYHEHAPNREQVINEDDCLNVKIMIESAKTIDEFIRSM